MTRPLACIPGVAETTLPAELVAELPGRVPPAPWRAQAKGLFWWQRLDADARAAAAVALPAELGDVRVTAAAGALISYASTPVGPYHEVIGLIVARRAARLIVHVPFIAVDSRASLVGGRENWALPKTLATFTGEPHSAEPLGAAAEGWSITAQAQGRGPWLPFAAPALANVVQVGPHRELWRSFSTAHGRSRLAHVTVDARGISFGEWFPSGACSGVVAVFAGNFRPAKRS